MLPVRNILNILMVAFFVLSTNAALSRQPDWVGGSSSEYPNEQYLIGRGVGSTAEEAQNRARGDLVSIFEVRIEVSNKIDTTVSQSGNNAQVSKQASQHISAKSDKVISGTNIAQVWRDPVTMDFHALAVLSRAQAGTSLRDEITKIDEDVQQQLKTANANKDPLIKLGALAHALETCTKRDGLQASLKVLDQSGRGLDAPVTQLSIERQIDDILKHVRIAPVVSQNSNAKEFPSILKGGLASAGFLATRSTDADFILNGKLDLVDLGRRENWNWVRATVEVSLVERGTGRVRGSKTWPIKSSAQDRKTARARALIEIEKLFKEELRSAMIEFSSS